jgi:hypothetical protein
MRRFRSDDFCVAQIAGGGRFENGLEEIVAASATISTRRFSMLYDFRLFGQEVAAGLAALSGMYFSNKSHRPCQARLEKSPHIGLRP